MSAPVGFGRAARPTVRGERRVVGLVMRAGLPLAVLVALLAAVVALTDTRVGDIPDEAPG